MKSSITSEKTACLNPRTGNTHNISKEKYDVVSKAVYHALKEKQSLTLSDLTKEVKSCLAQQKIKFEGSLSWYVVSVKLDMEARGVIETYQEKGRKMNKLAAKK